MIYKNTFIGSTVAVIVIIIVLVGLSKRRELPFQEIIPLNRGIAVINAGKWYNESLQISLMENGNATALAP